MVALYGKTLWGDPIEPAPRNKLSGDFLVPPFSVLNARDGWWQERKKAWLRLGIQGEVGRNAKSFNTHEWMQENAGGARGQGEGVSVFDPVLCELCYRWFCPPAGQVVDPFAGGSVRGIVAHELGRSYWGCDIRQEQIDANIAQDQRPTWVRGDALEIVDIAPAADFIFSCPPYGDLERYSDDPADLSTMEYHTFIAQLKRIVLRCWAKLKQDRFACFVVGEFRDKRGNYRNFVGDTISAFKSVGFGYYNEAILVTPCGSLPVRAGNQFVNSRKLGKTHQNILVFVKGDSVSASGFEANFEEPS